jgi:short-subunit dehydrogenase
METSNKYALITGASAGIGYELAKLFAADGYNLILVARDEQELSKAAADMRQHNIEITTITKDLFVSENASSLYEDVQRMGIKIDVLVNNAGQGVYGLFKDTELKRELDIIQLNISSMVNLTKLFVKDMVDVNSGKILNLASIASTVPGPWQAVYHGTKAFVLSFTEALREELREYDITITALLPGPTDTDFFNKANMQRSKIVQDKESLSNAADVAKDGFEALMAGKDKVISGFKNKMQVAMGTIMPDATTAHMMAKQQEPVDKK